MAKAFYDTTTQITKVVYLPEEKMPVKPMPIETKDSIKILKGYIGIQVVDTTTDLKGFQGQLFLVGKGTKRLCAYINGNLYSVDLT